MKKNSRSTFSYFVRNFASLFVFALIPSVLFAICSVRGLGVDFFPTYILSSLFNGGVVDFDNASANFFAVFNKNWILFLVGFVLTCVAVSMIFSKIEVHIRYGIKRHLNLIKRAKRNIGAFALFILMFFAFFIVVDLVLLGLGFAVNKIGISPTVFEIIVIVFAVASRVAICVLFANFAFALSALQSEGYKLNVSISYSVRLVSKKPFSAIKLAILYLVLKSVVVAVGIFVPFFAVKVIVSFLYYAFWMIYLPCYCCIGYFEAVEGDRKDLPIFDF